ncbi:hypothetical protein K4F52_000810 [Lecanicillium sp. MT-2017a]|nr:hypothetical protein K4F52_000810 [Lecanicillium sp. MT-2017a]
MKRDYRKPLAIFFSKSLLRSPLTRSPVCDFTGESKFCPVIADVSETSDESIKKVMICTGQVYAALQRYRAAHGIDNVAITRVEELSPFPFGPLKDNIDKYRNAQQVVWVQEEHYNSGAWHHVRDCIETVLKHSKYHSCALQYAGRKVSATTAAGSKKTHAAEEEALLVEAFSN